MYTGCRSRDADGGLSADYRALFRTIIPRRRHRRELSLPLNSVLPTMSAPISSGSELNGEDDTMGHKKSRRGQTLMSD
jgi:hypothetical protein